MVLKVKNTFLHRSCNLKERVLQARLGKVSCVLVNKSFLVLTNVVLCNPAMDRTSKKTVDPKGRKNIKTTGNTRGRKRKLIQEASEVHLKTTFFSQT